MLLAQQLAILDYLKNRFIRGNFKIVAELNFTLVSKLFVFF